MQEHFCLVEGVSEIEANTMLNNSTWKEIKDAFKQARLVSIVVYYTQVLKQQMKPTCHTWF
jgi:hypothetical protein